MEKIGDRMEIVCTSGRTRNVVSFASAKVAVSLKMPRGSLYLQKEE